MKTALIIGSRGQDGSFLTDYLRQKDYRVIGVSRRAVDVAGGRSLRPVDILRLNAVSGFIGDVCPDEIYYLAAFHHSSENLAGDPAHLLRKSFAVHVEGLLNVLEAVRKVSPDSRVFYAASSHIFGDVKEVPQKETTAMNPDCAYGVTKAAGRQLCHLYRKRHGVYASVGILYNHESPLRSEHFVSRKIVRAAWAIKQGGQKELVLGDLMAKADWGYAGDYVKAMHRILQLKTADDFIVSSGKLHTVGNFVNGVFKELGLDPKRYVRQDPKLLKKSPGRLFWGDHAKLTRAAGWKPQTDFNKLITLMVRAEREGNA